MSSTKVLLILLIIVSVLFVVFVAWGAKKNASEPAPAADTFNSGEHSTLASFNGVFGSFGPKLKASELQPQGAAFDLRTQPEYSLTVLPDSKHKFRQAKFLVQPSAACAEVTFTAIGKLPDKVDNPQDSNQRHDKHSNEFTFTIFEDGGTLKIDRVPPTYTGVCKVILE